MANLPIVNVLDRADLAENWSWRNVGRPHSLRSERQRKPKSFYFDKLNSADSQSDRVVLYDTL